VTRSFTLHNPSASSVRFSIKTQEQGLFSVGVTQGKEGATRGLAAAVI